MAASRVLVVVTSHGLIENVPRTGIWFTEFSEPYAEFIAKGCDLVVASPRGAAAPVDPRSYPDRSIFADAHDALQRLNATYPVAAMNADDFDAIFLPGGHGPMFDTVHDRALKALLRAFHAAAKPIGAVCHGPAGLLGVEVRNGGTLLKGRRVTGFTHAEDAVDELFRYMPFSLQDAMAAEGATFIEKPPKTPHVEVDGLLVTGQNPASGGATARAFSDVLAGVAHA